MTRNVCPLHDVIITNLNVFSLTALQVLLLDDVFNCLQIIQYVAWIIIYSFIVTPVIEHPHYPTSPFLFTELKWFTDCRKQFAVLPVYCIPWYACDKNAFVVCIFIVCCDVWLWVGDYLLTTENNMWRILRFVRANVFLLETYFCWKRICCIWSLMLMVPITYTVHPSVSVPSLVIHYLILILQILISTNRR